MLIKSHFLTVIQISFILTFFLSALPILITNTVVLIVNLFLLVVPSFSFFLLYLF